MYDELYDALASPSRMMLVYIMVELGLGTEPLSFMLGHAVADWLYHRAGLQHSRVIYLGGA